jgi:tetratricopeptide (TPR) repeat protein
MTNNLSPQEIADQAKLTYQAGDTMLAAQQFAEAAAAFAGAGDALQSAEMKNNRSVALLLVGEAQASLEAVEGTEAIFGAAGDFRRQGMALANQASALQALKRFNDAMDYYQRAADSLEKANEGDLRADVMQLLSTLHLRRFKFYDAILTLQSGLAGVKNPTLKQRIMKKILSVRV